MKAEDVLTAGVAFAAVVGVGLYLRQRGALGAGGGGLAGIFQPVTRFASPPALTSQLAPSSLQSIWANPSAPLTTADVEDAEMGAWMRAQQPGWSALDQEDADYGLAMRGIGLA